MARGQFKREGGGAEGRREGGAEGGREGGEMDTFLGRGKSVVGSCDSAVGSCDPCVASHTSHCAVVAWNVRDSSCS